MLTLDTTGGIPCPERDCALDDAIEAMFAERQYWRSLDLATRLGRHIQYLRDVHAARNSVCPWEESSLLAEAIGTGLATIEHRQLLTILRGCCELRSNYDDLPTLIEVYSHVLAAMARKEVA